MPATGRAGSEPGMHRTRQEILRTQLVRAGHDLSDAVRELREVLIGVASELDTLQTRVKKPNHWQRDEVRERVLRFCLRGLGVVPETIERVNRR